LLVDNNLDSL
jgi:hypothetical protein